MDFEAVFSGPSSFEEVGILTRRGKLPSGLEPDPEHHSRDSQELQEGGGVFEKIDMVSVSIEPAEEKMARFTNWYGAQWEERDASKLHMADSQPPDSSFESSDDSEAEYVPDEGGEGRPEVVYHRRRCRRRQLRPGSRKGPW